MLIKLALLFALFQVSAIARDELYTTILKNPHPIIAKQDTAAALAWNQTCRLTRGGEPLAVEEIMPGENGAKHELYCLEGLDCAFKDAKLDWEKVFSKPAMNWESFMCLKVGCKHGTFVEGDIWEYRRKSPPGVSAFHRLMLCPLNKDNACPTPTDCFMYGMGAVVE
jgi:hypothetical protein